MILKWLQLYIAIKSHKTILVLSGKRSRRASRPLRLLLKVGIMIISVYYLGFTQPILGLVQAWFVQMIFTSGCHFRLAHDISLENLYSPSEESVEFDIHSSLNSTQNYKQNNGTTHPGETRNGKCVRPNELSLNSNPVNVSKDSGYHQQDIVVTRYRNGDVSSGFLEVTSTDKKRGLSVGSSGSEQNSPVSTHAAATFQASARTTQPESNFPHKVRFVHMKIDFIKFWCPSIYDFAPCTGNSLSVNSSTCNFTLYNLDLIVFFWWLHHGL